MSTTDDRIAIRQARPEEYDEVGRLTERAFGAGPYGHLPVSPERRTLVLDVAARAASGAVLVAVRPDGAIVGTATLLRAGTAQSRLAVGDEAELRLLGVDAAARRLGLGRALALAAQEVALGWGAPAVVLDTGTLNIVSQSLYASLGYELIPNRSVEADGSPIQHVEYLLPLRERDDVIVRLVRPDEYEAVADLSERAYTIEYDITESYRSSIRQIAERAQEHQVWVATDAVSGRLLGAVATPRPGGSISPLARDGELDFRLLAVDPPARGRGIGALLTLHVIELARLRGLDHVVMNSGAQMVGAHRLYEKLGFDRMLDREGSITEGGRTIQLLSFSIPVDQGRRPALARAEERQAS